MGLPTDDPRLVGATVSPDADHHGDTPPPRGVSIPLRTSGTQSLCGPASQGRLRVVQVHARERPGTHLGSWRGWGAVFAVTELLLFAGGTRHLAASSERPGDLESTTDTITPGAGRGSQGRCCVPGAVGSCLETHHCHV